MKLKSSWLVTLLVSLALISPSLYADSTLSITCVDANDNPLENVNVVVQALGSGDVDQETTNSSGAATFEGLSDDVYRVMGRTDGYAPAFFEFVQLQGDQKESVQLTFEEGDSEQQLYFENEGVLNQSNQLTQEGAQALQSSQFDVAEEKLTQSLEINPSNLTTVHNLAVLYLQTNQIDKAEETLQNELQLLDVYKTLQEPGQEQALAQQEQQVEQLLASIPFRRTVIRADQAMQEKNFDEAVSAYDELIEMQPDNAAIYYNKAVAQVQAERIDEAEETLQRALDLDPDQKMYRDLQDQIDQYRERQAVNEVRKKVVEFDELYKAEDYQEVVNRSDELLQESPEQYHSMILLSTARAHRELGNVDQAVQTYEKVIEKQSNQPEFQNELANYLLAEERYDEAIEAYRRFFEASDKPLDEGLYQLGQEFTSKGNQDLAAKVFQQVVEVNPEHAPAIYQLGVHYFYDLEDHARARAQMERYLELVPEGEFAENARSVLAVIEKGSQ